MVWPQLARVTYGHTHRQYLYDLWCSPLVQALASRTKYGALDPGLEGTVLGLEGSELGLAYIEVFVILVNNNSILRTRWVFQIILFSHSSPSGAAFACYFFLFSVCSCHLVSIPSRSMPWPRLHLIDDLLFIFSCKLTYLQKLFRMTSIGWNIMCSHGQPYFKSGKILRLIEFKHCSLETKSLMTSNCIPIVALTVWYL